MSKYSYRIIFIGTIATAFFYQLCIFCEKYFFLYLSVLSLVAITLLFGIFNHLRRLPKFLVFTHLCQDLSCLFLTCIERYNIFPIQLDCNHTDGYKKICQHLTQLSTTIVTYYLSPIWIYMSYSPAFLMSLQKHIAKTFENLGEKILYLDISDLCLKAIWKRALLLQKSHSRKSIVPLNLKQRNQEIKRLCQLLLRHYSPYPTKKTLPIFVENILAEIVTVECLIPVLDLIASPRIFFIIWTALLINDPIDVYIQKCIKKNNTSYEFIPFIHQQHPGDLDFVYSQQDSLLGNLLSSSTYPTVDKKGESTVKVMIKCIRIPFTNMRLDSREKAFVTYIIQFEETLVDSQNVGLVTARIVERRYSEFVYLHKLLEKYDDFRRIRGPSVLNPSLNSSKDSKVEQRRIFLEDYLQKICSRDPYLTCAPLRDFFSPNRPPADVKPSQFVAIQRIHTQLNKLWDRVWPPNVEMSEEGVPPGLERISTLNSLTHNGHHPSHHHHHLHHDNHLRHHHIHSSSSASSEHHLMRSLSTPDLLNAEKDNSNLFQRIMQTDGKSTLERRPSIDILFSGSEADSKDSFSSLPSFPTHQMPLLPNYPEDHNHLQSNYVWHELPTVYQAFIPPKSLEQLVENHLRPVPWMASFRRLVVLYRPLISHEELIKITKSSLFSSSSTPPPPPLLPAVKNKKNTLWTRFTTIFTRLFNNQKQKLPQNTNSQQQQQQQHHQSTINDQGVSLLLCCGLFWRKISHCVWNILSILVDPIIQHYFEDLLQPGRIANYLQLLIDVVWPTDPSQPTLTQLCQRFTTEEIRLAAAHSFIEALPVIAYGFVSKEQLFLVIGEVLKDFNNEEVNRIHLFELFQLLSDELLSTECNNGSSGSVSRNNA